MGKTSHAKQTEAGGGTEHKWGLWKIFITTAKKISVWSEQSQSTVFTSGSEGIVRAKQAKDGNVLAVAGSQVVVLHKIANGQPLSYRLKGAEGNCKLLDYSKDGKTLYFTSSIQNAIHGYSTAEDRVSDSHKSHPSPITTFCSSSDSTLLLSTSADPPTISIENLQLRTSTALKPKASPRKVVISTFHPTRKNVFALAFADGVLAAYDFTRLARGNHIHAFNHLHDASLGGTGISAVEFIPGSKCRAVSVGEDGRLFIVDFDRKDVVSSFHVGAPATSLSLRTLEPPGKMELTIKGTAAQQNIRWFAAIGTVHGWSYVFDSSGKKLGEWNIDEEGSEILGVEWYHGTLKMPPILQPEGSKSSLVSVSSLPSIKGEKGKTPKKKRSQKAESPELSDVVEKTVENTEVDTDGSKEDKKKKPKETSKTNKLASGQPAWQSVIDTYNTGYMSLFSPVKGAELEQESELGRRRSARLSQGSKKTIASDQVPKKKTVKEQAKAGNIDALLEISASDGLVATVSAPQLSSDVTPPEDPKNGKTTSDPLPRRGKAIKHVEAEEHTAFSVPEIEGGTDKKMLKDIKTIRKKMGGADDKRAKGGLSLFAPYLPNARVMKLKEGTDGKENADGETSKSKKAKNTTAGQETSATSSGDEGEGDTTIRDVTRAEHDSQLDLWLSRPPASDLMGKRKLDSAVTLEDNTESSTSSRSGSKKRKTSDEEQWMTTTNFTAINAPRPAAADTQMGNMLNDIKESFRRDIQSLQVEMIKQFQLQKRHFDEEMKKQRVQIEGLREENGELKKELDGLLHGSGVFGRYR